MRVINEPKIIINKNDEKALRDVRNLAQQICCTFEDCDYRCPFHTVTDSRCLLDLIRVALERLEEKTRWEVDEE